MSCSVSERWRVLHRAPRVLGISEPHPGGTAELLEPRSKRRVASLPCLSHSHHPGWQLHAAATRGLLHHLLHVAEMLQQTIHFVDRTTRASRDARAARAVDDLRRLAFLWRHGEDDRLDV